MESLRPGDIVLIGKLPDGNSPDESIYDREIIVTKVTSVSRAGLKVSGLNESFRITGGAYTYSKYDSLLILWASPIRFLENLFRFAQKQSGKVPREKLLLYIDKFIKVKDEYEDYNQRP